MKKIRFLFLCVLLGGAISLFAQSPVNNEKNPVPSAVTIDSSNLPLVLMKLPFLWPTWDPIPDTPKVTVDMGVIDNGYNAINHVADPKNVYLGKIGIEKRGSISQAFWYSQKSYGFETRDTLGNNLDAVLLNMPKEHDWVLYAPFDDHTLMRNVVTYELAREMGYYAPRTKFCEVQFYDWAWTPDYRGLYVMMEKIKRDKNRVNISKLDANDNSGDSLTGGYIFAVDKNIWASDSGWVSKKDTGVFFTYKYPKGDVITPQQKSYIQSYVDSFETALKGPSFADPATGYKKYIDETSFMDFFFIQELSKNIDGYKRSSYLYKDKNSKDKKIYAGPHWDYNSAWNVHLCGFDSVAGWDYPKSCWVNAAYHVPFWWGRFLQDSSYTHDLKCRWMYLRSTVLDTTNIFHIMDSISGYISTASVRHFSQFTINTTLKVEVDSLKLWIAARLAWMDANMPGNCWNLGTTEEKNFENSFSIYPNPVSENMNVDFYLGTEKNIRIELLDAVGRKMQTIKETTFLPGSHTLSLNLKNYSPGLYLLQVSDPSYTAGSGTTLFTRKRIHTE